MKALLLLVGCMAALSGCDKAELTQPNGKVRLPGDVAGTWKARDSAWKIVLTTDGRVESAVIAMGSVEIRPNNTTRVKMIDGSFSTYRAGDCTVDYDPEFRELRVVVNVDEIKIAFVDVRIEGSTMDVFTGTVSEDGTVWQTDWLNFFDLGERFPADPNHVGAPLVFDKVGK